MAAKNNMYAVVVPYGKDGAYIIDRLFSSELAASREALDHPSREAGVVQIGFGETVAEARERKEAARAARVAKTSEKRPAAKKSAAQEQDPA
jgi:hypothetical protein